MNDTQRTGLMVALKLPRGVENALMEYPLTTEDQSNLHITLMYLGAADDFDVPTITAMVRGWAERNAAMIGKLGGVGTFNNLTGHVLWASVNMPGLEDAHVSLRAMFEQAGVKISHANGFTPHATLSYSEEAFTDIPALPDRAMEEFAANSVWVVAGSDWTEVSLSTTSSKAAAHPDAIPQERLTSLTRGRGPRRGNLEDLLNYWRPIMKKPGGFRRCIVILADHPELYPLPPLCAWLHHETTGLWPNEGNHHGGGKKKRGRKVTRRVRSARRGKKSFDGEIAVTALRLAKRESRDSGGLLTQPIAGRDNVVEFKAALYRRSLAPGFMEGETKVGFITSGSRTGRVAQSAGSVVTPGDLGDVRHPVRSSIFEALSPGGLPGRGGRKPGLPNIGRGTRAARNAFRCPPGFEKGGTFTNSGFSTCGRQIIAIPKSGPGSLSEAAEARLQKLAEDASLVRSIGDLRNNRNPFDIIRAAQIPEAPKEVGVSKRQSSVDLVLNAFDKEPDTDFGSRVVRRDGVVLEPSVSLGALNKLGEFDDLNDGLLIVKDTDREPNVQIGRDEIPAMVTGLRATIFHIPGEGSISVRRVGGDVKPAEREGFNRKFAAALKSVDLSNGDPTAAIRKFVEDSDGRYALDQNVGPNRTLITVERDGRKINVPQWVFSMYLSRTAPRRDPETQPWTESKDTPAKALSVFAIKSQNPVAKDVSESCAPYFGIVQSRVDDFLTLSNDDEKAGLRRRARRAATPGGGGGGKRRIADLVPGGRGRGGGSGATWDPKSERFRCPSGTGNGGFFSDQFGRNCGARLDNDTIEALARKGKLLGVSNAVEGVPEVNGPISVDRSKERPKWRAFDNSMKEAGRDFDQALANVGAAVSGLRAIVKDAAKGRGRDGRIGPSLGERSERVELDADQLRLLEGNELLAALNELADVLDEAAYADAPDGAAVQAFQQIEKAATAEAGRLGAAAPKTREQLRKRRDVRHALNRLLDKVDAPVSKPDEERKPRVGGVVGRVVNRLADGVDRPADQAPARRLRNAANRVVDRFAGGGQNRRDPVPIPELEDLNDRDKAKVQAAMIEVWEELEDGWQAAVGVDEFNLPEVQQFIRRRRQANPDDPGLVILERRRDDWLELGQLIDNEDENIDLADIAGRLAPAHRENVIRTADLSFTESRNRQREARVQREESDEAERLLQVRADRDKQRARQVARADRKRGSKKKEAAPVTRMLPSKEGSDTDRLGPVQENGFSYVAKVEDGNAGIADLEGAVEFVKQGGALSDVPDTWLGRAIIQNPDRFKAVGKDDKGVNGMRRFRDDTNGKLIGVKFAQRGDTLGQSGGKGFGVNEAFSEIVGAHLSDRFGFLQGQARFDGPPSRGNGDKRTPMIVVEMAQNVIPDNSAGGNNKLIEPDYRNIESADINDAVRLSFLDFVQANTDRHGGNYFMFQDPTDDGSFRIYPIDNGLALTGRPKQLRDRDRKLLTDLDIDDQLNSWTNMSMGGGRNGIVGNLQNDVYGDEATVVAAIEDMKAQMAEADQLLSFGDAISEIRDATPHDPQDIDNWDLQIRSASDRYDWILDTPAQEIYDRLTGK